MAPVRVSVPAEARFLRTLRLTAAGCADLAGFDEADIEDLRLAVDELSVALLSHGAGELTLEFRIEEDVVTVSGVVPSADPAVEPVLDGLAGQLLDAAVASWQLVSADSKVTFVLRKVASRPSA